MHYLVAVGSNLGDRQQALDSACARLPPTVRCLRTAPAIHSPAMGGPRHSGPFLNGAWVVETALGPHQLLWQLLAIEQSMGRVRNQDHGPRRIDLDLILAQSFWQVDSPFLTLPHPRCHLRPFVLQPAVSIAGDWWHPQQRCSLNQLWQRLQESMPSP